MGALIFLLVIGTTIWVGIDAGNRDWSQEKRATRPAAWVIGCLFLWIVFFPYYLVKRSGTTKKGELSQLPPPVVRAVAPAPAPVATKPCPDCAETVLADARVCKHCGYRFAPIPAAL